MKKDNAGLNEKMTLRKAALKAHGPDPVIMETHAGFGVLYRRLYQGLMGMAMEKDEAKCAALVKQRPTWPVYQCDSTGALEAGLGAELSISFIDIDPYGNPWPTIHAFLRSGRERPGRFVLAVNDGLRQKVRMGGAWHVESLRAAVDEFGANLHDVYLEVCRWMLEREDFTLEDFRGFYGGHAKQMTHYYAVLTC